MTRPIAIAGRRSLGRFLAPGAGLALALGLGACGAGNGVATASGGTFEESFLVQTLSGTGIVESRREPIDYRPRSPLVLPQNYELRQPEQATAAANWPNDPDRQRSSREAELAGLTPEDYRRRTSSGEEGARLLSDEEMRAGTRRAGSFSNRHGVPGEMIDSQNVRLMPDQLRVRRDTDADRMRTQGAEPARQYLTDPPAGFRTPVAQTPEGAVAAQAAEEARQAGRRERTGLGRFLPF